jgi:crossover junction endodeoxyribonuclease RuvC
MRVLGVDPGSRATGYGVIEIEGATPRARACGVIRPRESSLALRLVQIQDELADLIREWRPDCAALESVFAAKNVRSALLLGHARGAALVACGRAGLEVSEYAPAEVKAGVVGYGRATKPQVQQMVIALLALQGVPAFDATDALAVGLCHANGLRLRTAIARQQIKTALLEGKR